MILETASLVLLTVVAGLVHWPLVMAAARQRRLHRWPQVTGAVTAHRSRLERDAYYPEHQVRIQLDGRETLTWCGSPDRAGITGHKSAGSSPRPDVAARRILDRHPIGTAMAVRVNPRNHEDACRVERELPLTLVAGAVGAVFAGFIGAVVWIVFLP